MHQCNWTQKEEVMRLGKFWILMISVFCCGAAAVIGCGGDKKGGGDGGPESEDSESE
jgi:hypothetical protein